MAERLLTVILAADEVLNGYPERILQLCNPETVQSLFIELKNGEYESVRIDEYLTDIIPYSKDGPAYVYVLPKRRLLVQFWSKTPTDISLTELTKATLTRIDWTPPPRPSHQ